MKMKKILGILLAVCFVLSVTAAAASAHEDKECGKWIKTHHGWKWIEVPCKHHHHNEGHNKPHNEGHNKPHNEGHNKPRGH